MEEKKLPPIEKIAEAYSVIADKRIKQTDMDVFMVSSSNGEKEYKVTVKGNYYRSNDSATKFARYPGYPVLAVLMVQHLIPVPENLLPYLEKINWNEINKKYKRDYAKALDAALAEKGISEDTINAIKGAMKNTYNKFIELGIKV